MMEINASHVHNSLAPGKINCGFQSHRVSLYSKESVKRYETTDVVSATQYIFLAVKKQHLLPPRRIQE